MILSTRRSKGLDVRVAFLLGFLTSVITSFVLFVIPRFILLHTKGISHWHDVLIADWHTLLPLLSSVVVYIAVFALYSRRVRRLPQNIAVVRITPIVYGLLDVLGGVGRVLQHRLPDGQSLEEVCQPTKMYTAREYRQMYLFPRDSAHLGKVR